MGAVSTTRELWGDALASKAARIGRQVDPAREGREVRDLLSELAGRGIRVRGSNPQSVLRSAMNRNQHIWERVGRGLWRWKDPDSDPASGLSGRELAEHARLLMLREGRPGGVWFESVRERLTAVGVVIRGPNPGQTLVRTFVAYPGMFENVRRGYWRAR